MERRRDRDLLAHEGQAEVADDRHAGVVGLGHLDAEQGRDLKAERARAAGRQVLLRLCDFLQLAAPDLRDAAAGGEIRILIKYRVHFLEHTVRHHRGIVVIGLSL